MRLGGSITQLEGEGRSTVLDGFGITEFRSKFQVRGLGHPIRHADRRAVRGGREATGYWGGDNADETVPHEDVPPYLATNWIIGA